MNLLFIYKNKNTQISMSIFISSINKCIIQTAVYSFHQLLKDEKKRLVCLNNSNEDKDYILFQFQKKTPEKAKLLSCDNRCVV